jgi:predicted SAM-dependent methyltransferase
MLNCGSGQRPFDSTKGWVNIDIQEKWNPDVVADWNDLSMFEDGSVDLIASVHSREHVDCTGAQPFYKEAHRVLKPSGSMLIFVPDLRALAQRWLLGQITDYIYVVNLMGAYVSHPSDRHLWHVTPASLRAELMEAAPWATIKPFDGRPIEGADNFGLDWWNYGTEVIK